MTRTNEGCRARLDADRPCRDVYDQGQEGDAMRMRSASTVTVGIAVALVAASSPSRPTVAASPAQRSAADSRQQSAREAFMRGAFGRVLNLRVR